MPNRLIQIPLNGGLNTQADPGELAADQCTILENLETDRRGMCYKRQLLGGSGTVALLTRIVRQALHWVDKDNVAHWIFYDQNDSKIYVYSSSWGYEETLTASALTGSPVDIQILNMGSEVRFANGPLNTPLVYQDIDREYAWGVFSYDDTDVDSCPPSWDDFATMVVTPGLRSSVNGDKELDVTYYYKLAPVFDGVQEGILNDDAYEYTPASGTTNIIELSVLWTTYASNWNNRLTGIRVYRSLAKDGPYYHVLTVGVSGGTGDPSLIYTDEGVHSRLIYDSDGVRVAGGNYIIAGTDYSDMSIDKDLVNSVTTDFGILNSSNVSLWGETYSVLNNIADSTVEDNDFEVNYDGWVGSNATPSLDTVVYHAGAQSLKIVCGSSGTATFTLSGLSSGDILNVDFWGRYDTGTSAYWQYSVDNGANWVLFTTQPSSPATWTNILENGLVVGAAGVFLIRVGISGAGTCNVDDLLITKKAELVDTGTGYSGEDVAGSSEWSFAEDTHANWNLLNCNSTGLTDSPSIVRVIENSFEKVVKITVPFLAAKETDSYTNRKIYICQSYIWYSASGNLILKIYDALLLDGVSPQLEGAVSIDVNYKYGVYLDGRLFAMNVALDPDGENELHPDWVMFSEQERPDVISISSRIPIRDLQGGVITGGSTLMGDLVIYCERGIYRLRIPVTNPLGWSLVEAEENIGCIAPQSITRLEQGANAFVSSNHCYILTGNFEAVSITDPIRDDYQAIPNLSESTTLYDPLRGVLKCKFGNNGDNVYEFDVWRWYATGEKVWRKQDYAGDTAGFHINRDMVITVKKLVSSNDVATYTSMQSLANDGTETVGVTRRTGWIPVTDLDDNSIIRRVSMIYKTLDDVTVTLYVDGNTDTVAWSSVFSGGTGRNSASGPVVTTPTIKSKRVGIRCKQFMVKFTTEATTNDVQIDRLEVEIG